MRYENMHHDKQLNLLTRYRARVNAAMVSAIDADPSHVAIEPSSFCHWANLGTDIDVAPNTILDTLRK